MGNQKRYFDLGSKMGIESICLTHRLLLCLRRANVFTYGIVKRARKP